MTRPLKEKWDRVKRSQSCRAEDPNLREKSLGWRTIFLYFKLKMVTIVFRTNLNCALCRQSLYG